MTLDNLSNDSTLSTISAFLLQLQGKRKEGGEGGSGAALADSWGRTFPKRGKRRGIVSKSSLLLNMDEKAVPELIFLGFCSCFFVF